MGRSGPDDVHHPAEVNIHREIPLIVAQIGEDLFMGDAGIVDDTVQTVVRCPPISVMAELTDAGSVTSR